MYKFFFERGGTFNDKKICTYLISTFTVYWTIRVIENVETRENGKIQLSELLQRINHKFTSNHIGGIIKRLYPSITSKKVRNQNDWTQTTVLYQGISFKSPLERFDKIQEEPPYLHF